jgi:hypothetical protein
MLIAAALIGETIQPFVWTCSECRKAFSLESTRSNPTASQFHKVDSEFRLHCQDQHPESFVVGLRVPTSKEDTGTAVNPFAERELTPRTFRSELGP